MHHRHNSLIKFFWNDSEKNTRDFSSYPTSCPLTQGSPETLWATRNSREWRRWITTVSDYVTSAVQLGQLQLKIFSRSKRYMRRSPGLRTSLLDTQVMRGAADTYSYRYLVRIVMRLTLANNELKWEGTSLTYANYRGGQIKRWSEKQVQWKR